MQRQIDQFQRCYHETSRKTVESPCCNGSWIILKRKFILKSVSIKRPVLPQFANQSKYHWMKSNNGTLFSINGTSPCHNLNLKVSNTYNGLSQWIAIAVALTLNHFDKITKSQCNTTATITDTTTTTRPTTTLFTDAPSIGALTHQICDEWSAQQK